MFICMLFVPIFYYVHSIMHAYRFGCCEIIISDQGREFINKVNEQLCLSCTKHCVSSAYHPQTNGLTKRFYQTLQTALLKIINEAQDDWDKHIPSVLFAYCTSVQKSTKLTPSKLRYCRYVMSCCEELCNYTPVNRTLCMICSVRVVHNYV